MLVWVQLAEIYGKALYREHGSEPSMLWKQAIERLTDQELQRGLKNLAVQALAYPANLGQFVEACKHIPEGRPWENQPKQIEDNRPAETMSYAEWKRQNGF
jgi:hypothetical protein